MMSNFFLRSAHSTPPLDFHCAPGHNSCLDSLTVLLYIHTSERTEAFSVVSSMLKPEPMT